MSTALIIIVTLLYMGVAVSELYQRNLGMTLVFLGYSIANLGFIMSLGGE